jgi:hypothetical protein
MIDPFVLSIPFALTSLPERITVCEYAPIAEIILINNKMILDFMTAV